MMLLAYVLPLIVGSDTSRLRSTVFCFLGPCLYCLFPKTGLLSNLLAISLVRNCFFRLFGMHLRQLGRGL